MAMVQAWLSERSPEKVRELLSNLLPEGAAEALASQLPHLLACAKFVEEHGVATDAALDRAEGYSRKPEYAASYRKALESLKALRRSRDEVNRG